MQLDTEEFGALAEMLSAQKISALKRELEAAREDAALWRSRYEAAETRWAAADIENLYLKNCFVLSLEKIKQFVEGLSTVERWAFLRSFVMWSMPEELKARELPMIEQVMPMPQPQQYTTNNYYESGSNCQVFNDKVEGVFGDGREE